ncbi:MAG: Re/Si-specific NAD(P)(+) transhydrogenase subunit alpha [Chthonomonadaceae bacterium]|nr:Re/Si-specific NAD(P)(+) transhydrogenase subunit alpha [Chthonomonadaceae bacterium]
MMTVGVRTETIQDETRVVLTPDGVGSLVGPGCSVIVQKGAGTRAHFCDADYEAVGAKIVDSEEQLLSESRVVLQVNGPADGGPTCPGYARGTVLVSFLWPAANPKTIKTLADKHVTTLALDLVPRITRAQSMDALSSMSTVAGYRAALIAAENLPRFFPMLMTAAGTLPPARILVIGAGVAGLQAIATCKRLGAVVEAFDVRPAVKEQIESLGAKFIGLSLLSDEAEDSGGYAKEVSNDTHAKELDLIASRLKNIDCVISTALIPGKKAPTLLTVDMLATMKPGSVVVDLAAPAGGNCEATLPGQVIVKHGVTVFGKTDLVAGLSRDASVMLSKNVVAFLTNMMSPDGLNLHKDDEIVKSTLVTLDGKIVLDTVRLAVEGRG